MKIKKTLLALAFSASLFSASSAHAVLTLTLDGQGVYDSDLNITWLRNANLAYTNNFSVGNIINGGTMDWMTAQQWIQGMNAANYLGYSDWRLPKAVYVDASCSNQGWHTSTGYNCTGSEIGHLFYTELGGAAHSSIFSSNDPDLALFQNIASMYWYGLEDYGWHSAWSFSLSYGLHENIDKGYRLNVWAVRDGGAPIIEIPERVERIDAIERPYDGMAPAISPVPEPETYAMLLAGLGLLSFTARRRKQSA